MTNGNHQATKLNAGVVCTEKSIINGPRCRDDTERVAEHVNGNAQVTNQNILP